MTRTDGRYYQSPREKRQFEILVSDDTISSAEWSATPTGATVGSGVQFTEGTDGGSRVLFGPATANTYSLVGKLTAASGQIYEHRFNIIVEEWP